MFLSSKIGPQLEERGAILEGLRAGETVAEAWYVRRGDQ